LAHHVYMSKTTCPHYKRFSVDANFLYTLTMTMAQFSVKYTIYFQLCERVCFHIMDHIAHGIGHIVVGTML